MYYKIDINGFYLGIKSEELPENWLFNTTIDLPNNLIKPRILNNVWVETYVEKFEVPVEVPLWRVKIILHELDLYDAVIIAMNSLEEPIKTRVNFIWEYGYTVDRNSQTVMFIGQVLNLTENQIDQIFINANAIQL
ncbi:MAG TPA: hypothetical protein PLL09_04700 [Flavobacterium sp.]|uniref:hypothetical protein n=1 Tax=unclassified Flavobacterium TaxID=196869 RepID=UPI0025C0AFD1|nr:MULTISPECIES: hypothetical protein [unclassified Flavobacterium]HRE77108.1 hypothetical protein [Flavobacterium sp.]